MVYKLQKFYATGQVPLITWKNKLLSCERLQGIVHIYGKKNIRLVRSYRIVPGTVTGTSTASTVPRLIL